jgi:hypothetical protein
MAVDRKALLADCQRQVKLLEADLKAQAADLPILDAALRAEYEAARAAGRVGDAFEIWRGEQATQAAVHWVLGGVFVRFLEDNGLIDPLLAGAGDRGRLAEGREQAFYAANPLLHERDWLLHAFRTVAALPGGAALFDEAHNPAFRWPLSPDAAKGLVQFWRRPDPAKEGLAHEFADDGWDTRFLGDLYQDLSEAARKKYALLQTPEFVEEFILDRTLGEAMKALPLARVTMIDPTCGSGHFLLGGFARLLNAWEQAEPGTPREVLAQRALDQVAGVDLNPYAVAISRFRLLIATLRACAVTRLDRAPGFRMHVAVGDALLHGDEPGRLALGDGGRGRYVRHAFSDEDLAEVNAVLVKRYAVVVGNPPYITPKDKALNQAYRERYRTCHMRYALNVPFVERFWELAATDVGGEVAGWIGQITAKSFMKREFGKKLIEEFFPRVDLTDVIDTEGAYIPGHGTPTVMLFGRARPAVSSTVRVVFGVRGEPGTPSDPAHGRVWSAIRNQADRPGSESAFISVADMPRPALAVHPWSLSGGGVIELKQLIDSATKVRLSDLCSSIGFASFPGIDDVFEAPRSTFRRVGIPETLVAPYVAGDVVRDWSYQPRLWALAPYDAQFHPLPLDPHTRWARRLWPCRSVLRSIVGFSNSAGDDRSAWWGWYRWIPQRYQAPLSITFAFVSTHNHFALSRGGVVFNRSAPVLLLSEENQAGHMGILGLLNSSVTCFWLKEVSHNMGDSTDSHGARVTGDPAFDTYQFNGTQLGTLPVPKGLPALLGSRLDTIAGQRQEELPGKFIARANLTRSTLHNARNRVGILLSRMICLQEELDWRCYHLYGITTHSLTFQGPDGGPLDPPPLNPGERAFEIVLARRVAAGEEETTWFARNGSTPITELPSHWPEDYRALVERRIAAIESDRNVGLIERPEYKRRWNVDSWDKLGKEALAGWLLDRLESPAYWPGIALQTTRDLAARAALDPEFAQVAALWAGTEGIALEPVIRQLALGEAVPFLPALRYTLSGREKRVVWERTWELQRREDAIDAAIAAELAPRENESKDAFAKRLAAAQKARLEAEIGAIPRPPKYASADFQSPVFWRMRGALDVPKERFIRYDLCGRDGEDAPLLGWAGWDHLQQAQALSAWYTDRTQQDGWQGERLVPLLAGMAELLPWLKQWHNQIDPEFGDRPGEAYELWLNGELHAQGLTRASLDAWEPPRAPRRGGRKSASKRTAAASAEE